MAMECQHRAPRHRDGYFGVCWGEKSPCHKAPEEEDGGGIHSSSGSFAALQLAADCKNVCKISFVAGPVGTGTICILAPGLKDIVVFNQFEVEMERQIKAKVSLSNWRILNWSYKLMCNKQPLHLEQIPLAMGRPWIATSEELPTPHTMYEWEAHGLLEALHTMDRYTADFSVIGLVMDNLETVNIHNLSQENSKNDLKI